MARKKQAVALGRAFVENHPRRCQKIRTRVPGSPRCYQWALKGSKYCKFHGGALARTSRKKQALHHTEIILTRFYSKELGPVLSEAVSKFLDTPVPQQQLALWDELAIMRHTATHACEMYREACEGKDKLRAALDVVLGKEAPNAELVEKLEAALIKADESLANAVAYMRDACKEVADVAGKAARVDAQVQATSGVITPAQVGLVVDQILRCAQDAFGGKKSVELEIFKELVKNNVKMPSSGAQGTTLTPDQDVRAMAATIPAPPSLGGDTDPDTDPI